MRCPPGLETPLATLLAVEIISQFFEERNSSFIILYVRAWRGRGLPSHNQPNNEAGGGGGGPCSYS